MCHLYLYLDSALLPDLDFRRSQHAIVMTLWIGRWVGFAGGVLPPFPCPTPLLSPISGDAPLIYPGAMAPAAPHPFHWGRQGMAVELPHSAQLQPTRYVIWPIQMTEKLYFFLVTPTGGCPMTAPLAGRGRCHARHGNWVGVFSTLLLNSPHLATRLGC